jgi:transposase-like protein
MTQHTPDDLWRDFPKTATEFEARFATEEDCRAYWIEARWGGKPACARCGSTYVWTIRDGTTFECRDCDHQTSLTSGTVLEKTRKPLKMWFRAVFEISTRRTGISAMDLMRIMGFGSYKTAWSWLHKLRAALVRPEREPLGPCMGLRLSRAIFSGPPRAPGFVCLLAQAQACAHPQLTRLSFVRPRRRLSFAPTTDCRRRRAQTMSRLAAQRPPKARPLHR